MAMLQRFRQRFRAGPSYMGIEPVRSERYQSPTLTALLWLYAWMSRTMTMPGRIVIMCTGLLLLYSLITPRMPIYALSFLLVSILLVDIAVGFITRPRLQVARRLPRGIGLGNQVRITYEVTNVGRRPAWAVNVDSLPLPVGLTFIQGIPFLETLAPGESTVVNAVLKGRRRGKYTLPAVRVDSAFPFNIWRWGRICGVPETLMVYPGYVPLRSLDLSIGRGHTPGGLSLASSVADSTEFRGCREYRDGDNPRHIHWRSWARAGYPVVKEFHEEYLPRTAVILDTYSRSGRVLERLGIPPRDPRFEAAIALTAAVSDILMRKDYIVDLFAAGPDIYWCQSGRSLGCFENILDILACLQPHRDEPFDLLAGEIAQEISHISSAVAILVVWNEVRRRLLDELTAAGIAVKAVLVAPAPPPDTLPPTVLHLTPEDIGGSRVDTV